MYKFVITLAVSLAFVIGGVAAHSYVATMTPTATQGQGTSLEQQLDAQLMRIAEICSTNGEGNPCHHPLPTPSVSEPDCPEGQSVNADCVAACVATFTAACIAARDFACAMMDALCAAAADAIDNAQASYDACINDGGDYNTCMRRFVASIQDIADDLESDAQGLNDYLDFEFDLLADEMDDCVAGCCE
jgi:hypothetical protein